ncbi:MAG: hypothetical protein ACR2N7_06215 [Acidimicrobiia bacterium]
MDQSGFRIRIVEQGWRNPDVPEDFRSIGLINLVIGGQQILTADDDQFGISEAGLALLRTLEFDYDPDEERWKPIPHGCGLLVMMGCPIGAHWRVRHDGDIVAISDVVHFPTASETDQVSFGDLTVKVPFSEYENEVVAFARNARTMFGAAPFPDHQNIEFLTMDDHIAPWRDFLDEYDHRLAQHTTGRPL